MDSNIQLLNANDILLSIRLPRKWIFIALRYLSKTVRPYRTALRVIGAAGSDAKYGFMIDTIVSY